MRFLTPIAAGLMALTTAVHVFAGGPEIMDAVATSALTPPVQSVVWVVWHGITLVLATMAIALCYLSQRSAPALRTLCLAVCLGFAALFIAAAVQLPGGFAMLPQWAIFLTLALLTWLGRPSSSTSAAHG